MSYELELAKLAFAEAAVGIEAVAPSQVLSDDDLITRWHRATDRARALYDLAPSESHLDADITDNIRSAVGHAGRGHGE